MRRRRPVAIVLFALILMSAVGAEAQAELSGDEATVRAREFFTEAIALADAGDWERAVDRFRSAIALRDAPRIRYNLASSLRRLGHLTEALGELDLVDGAADVDEAVRELAAVLRAEIAPRIGRLRVDVPGNSSDAHVTVDGNPWAATGQSAPVDPGIRVVRLFRGASEFEMQRVDVPDGGEARVVFERLDVTRPTRSQPIDAPPRESDDRGVIWGLVIGAAVLAIGAAVLIGFFVADQSGPMPSMGDFTPPLLRVD